MIITEKFKQVLYGLIISSFVLLFFSLIVLPSLKWDNDVKQAYQMIIGIFYSFALWYGISFITKKQNLSLIAFFVQNSVKFYFLALQLFNSNSFSNNSNVYYYLSLLLAIIAFSGFGYSYFNNQKGLWLGIVGLFLTSASSGGNAFYLLENIFFEIHTLHIAFYAYVDLFFQTFTIPIPFLIFWILFNKINQQNFSEFDFSFSVISKTNSNDKVLLSIIFWMFRIGVSGILFSGAYFIYSNDYGDLNNSLITIINTIIFCFWIYFIGSVYRNFLTSVFINQGKHPNWFYYLLNIPLLNVIAWLIYLFIGGGDPSEGEENVLDQHNTIGKTRYEIQQENLQEVFVSKRKNRAIKILLLGIIMIYLILELISLNGYGSYDDILNLLISKAILITGLILYFKYKQIGYIIFAIGSILLIFYTIFNLEFLLAYFSPTSMLSVIILYPLFHFDKMKIEEQKSSS